MKKRTLLLSQLPDWLPDAPDPNNYGNPQQPGDPGWDEYQQAVEDWEQRCFDIIDDKITQPPPPTCSGQWYQRFVDHNGVEHKIDQDSTRDEVDAFNQSWDEFVQWINANFGQPSGTQPQS